ncbi:MAG: ABC transporter ATP-binding protein, partial [Acidimicrobiales bacterium]
MTAVFRVLWPFTRGRRTAFASGLAGTLLVTASELARPFPLKFVLDRLLARDATPVRPAFVVGVAALVVAIALFGAAGTYLAEAGPRRAGEHVVHDLRVAIYAHLQRLSLRYHRRISAGDLVTRLTGDVHAVGELVTESLVKLGGAVLLLAGMLVVGLLLDPILTLAAIAITPLLAVATVVSRRTVKAAARQQRTAEGAIASLATESLTAIDTVKALGNEASEAGRLRGRSEQRRDASVAGVTAESRFAGVVGLLEAVGTAVVLGVGVLRVTAGAISPGDLVVMHSYVRRLYRPLRDLARQTGRVSRSLARGERIAEVLAADETLPERPGAHAGGRSSGHVELRDVHFSYTPGRPALRGLTLDIAPGSTVAIVGTSGAGKSTLAALVGRFYDPDRGAVVLDGHDLRDCSLAWLRTQVGFVLQDTATFSGTVAENIAFGTDATAAQIVTAARVAGADDFVAELPDGYRTDLGAGGANLSGGQRQRLSIARTLLRDPAVVVLDEPTTGLDATSERAVASSIARLLEGRTTILITHALRLARRSDRVIVLDRGRVVDDGRPEDLITGDGAFRRLAVAQGLASPAPPPAPHDP